MSSIRRTPLVALLGAALGGALGAACGGGHAAHTALVAPARDSTAPSPGVDSLAALAARQARDSAADQTVLDSLHGARPHADTLQQHAVPTPPLKGEDVEREAVRLFGPEGKTAIGAAPPAAPTFDIDVSSFATTWRVLEYLEFFQVDSRDRFEIWLSRLGRYEGMIRERLRAKRLPEDLLYLCLIESGFSNTAVSRARAVGMWQFMASTARLYGLTVDPWVDERRDPFRATEAAANYLADLRERLGSVYLAAAAYNAGVGRIERGIDRLPGEPDSVDDRTFFQLSDRRYLRRETRDYVPKLIAASLIAKQPQRYGFQPEPFPPLVFDEVTVPDATGLDVIARLADTSVAALLDLNPQFVRGVTPPGRSVVVRVPRGHGTLVAERYDSLPVTERITFVDHYVSRGQTLSDIAKHYREPPAPGARAAGGPADHHSDERTRGARVGLVGPAGAALPSRVEHRRERGGAPRATGGDGERDRAPLRRVAHGAAQLQRPDDGIAATGWGPAENSSETIET